MHLSSVKKFRKKIMPRGAGTLNARAYLANGQFDKKSYKGKEPDLKCEYCHSPGHTMDRCWSRHPELKPKFGKDKRGGNKNCGVNHKAHLA